MQVDESVLVLVSNKIPRLQITVHVAGVVHVPVDDVNLNGANIDANVHHEVWR
jgi:hypothetical protein